MYSSTALSRKCSTCRSGPIVDLMVTARSTATNTDDADQMEKSTCTNKKNQLWLKMEENMNGECRSLLTDRGIFVSRFLEVNNVALGLSDSRNKELKAFGRRTEGDMQRKRTNSWLNRNETVANNNQTPHEITHSPRRCGTLLLWTPSMSHRYRQPVGFNLQKSPKHRTRACLCKRTSGSVQSLLELQERVQTKNW